VYHNENDAWYKEVGKLDQSCQTSGYERSATRLPVSLFTSSHDREGLIWSKENPQQHFIVIQIELW
jgi:hypothetical protein